MARHIGIRAPIRATMFLLLFQCIAACPDESLGAAGATPGNGNIARLQASIARLQKQLDELKARMKESELERLREAARREAASPEPSKTEAGKERFEAKGLSLQQLNPELSVTGDMVNRWSDSHAGGPKSDFHFRGMGLHFQSYLDPYSRFKAAVPVNEDGAELEEVYVTRFGVAKGLNITFGKFKQQFGVVNRWHKHGLDQSDYPLALQQVFGEEGLNQTGFSFEWTQRSSGPVQHQLVFQITNGTNDRIFGENSRNRPSILAHYKNYRDIDENSYFEFGISALYGWNDQWEVGGSTVTDEQNVQVLGLDFSLLWEPANNMRYRNRLWRTEAYLVKKDVLARDGSGEDSIEAWGFYSYLQQKVSRTTEIGVRYDYFDADDKTWAVADDAPLAYSTPGITKRAYTPYVTWWQSPFVKFRCEFSHIDSDIDDEDENRFIFQAIFAAGPHKHERY